MKNIFILFLIVFSIAFIILLILDKIEAYRCMKQKKALFQNSDEEEIKLMIGFNYISNLNKLDSIVNELMKSNIDDSKLEYMEKIIETTNNNIYDDEMKEMTTYYENEFLYKNNIINLDVVFYGFKYLFNKYKENEFNLDNNIDNEEFKKKVSELYRKSNKIVKRKKDKLYYYDNVEKIKIEYKTLIDESNPSNVLFFIKDAIQNLSKIN